MGEDERCVVTGEEGAETYVEGPMGCAHGDSRSPILRKFANVSFAHTRITTTVGYYMINQYFNQYQFCSY